MITQQQAIERITGWGVKITEIIDRINAYMAPSPAEGELELSPTQMARKPILVGGWLFIILFGFFGLWAVIAPIASAAIAPGKIILSGNKKTIQHFEGGIVDEIYVREGETVKAGEALIKLNETAARARLDLYRKQLLAAQAAEARLLAERDNKDEISFPPAVMKQRHNPDMAEIIESQQRLFNSRRTSIASQAGIIEQKKAQYSNEIKGLEAQIKAATAQIGYLQEEIHAVSTLLKQGNAQKPRLLALQRAQADLQGKRGEYKSSISRAEQAIAEADLEILNLQNDFANKVAAEYKENVDKIADLQERLKASEDIMDRIIITAPLSGVVTDLQAHTIGGVIKPGDKIMDIVPIDELLVQAMVSPQDIDVVKEGLEAHVRLTAYKARAVPPLKGVVVGVSADRFENPNNGQSFFLARVQINESELQEHKNIQLTPGMPADVLIITGERTLFGYMMTPITDAFRKAFREQ